MHNQYLTGTLLHPIRRRNGPWIQFRVPHGLEWNQYNLEIPSLADELDGLKIVHITDMHFKPFGSRVWDHVAQRINRANADLLLITGDFVDNKADAHPSMPHVLRFVSALRARLGIYAILGNHDGDLVGPDLSDSGITLLENQRIILQSDRAGLEIIGVTAVSRNDLDESFLRQLPPRPPGWLRILMSHFPDTLRRVRFLDADLILSGHTHGGQICLPGGHPIIKHDSLPAEMCSGVRRVGNTWFIVNRGLGFTGLPLRLFCPAEVIELILHKTG